MIELFVSSLITFFVVIDPPGCATDPAPAGVASTMPAAAKAKLSRPAALLDAVATLNPPFSIIFL